MMSRVLRTLVDGFFSVFQVKFSVIPEWGDDLGSEHERYVAEQVGARHAHTFIITRIFFTVFYFQRIFFTVFDSDTYSGVVLREMICLLFITKNKRTT